MFQKNPIGSRSSKRVKDAAENIKKMEMEYFISYGLSGDAVEKDLWPEEQREMSEEEVKAPEETAHKADLSLPTTFADTSKSSDLGKKQLVHWGESKEDLKEEADEEGAPVTPKEEDWVCTCDHTKNVKTSVLFKKDDPFMEVGSARLNIWNQRKRQFESRFGGRLRDELRRTVKPDPIEVEKNRELTEDNVWLSDMDKQLIRFVHKQPLSRLRNFNRHGETFGKGEDDKEAFEEGLNERVEYAVMCALRRANKLFTLLMKEHAMQIRDAEQKKFFRKLQLELGNAKAKCLQAMTENEAKLRQELTSDFELKLKNLTESMACELDHAMKIKEQELKNVYGFLTNWTVWDNYEKTQVRLKEYARKCIEWMEKLKAEQEQCNRLAQTYNEMNYNSRLMAMLDENRQNRLKDMNKIEVKHQRVEKALLSLLVNTICDAEEEKKVNASLVRKVAVGYDLIKELMREYQKFITYTLKEKPAQSEFMLSYYKLLELQLHDAVKEKTDEDLEEETEIKLSKIKLALEEDLTPKVGLDTRSAEIEVEHSDIDYLKYKQNIAREVLSDAIDLALPPTTALSDYEDYPPVPEKSEEKHQDFLISYPSYISSQTIEDKEDHFPTNTSTIGGYLSALDFMLKDKPKQKVEVKKEKPKHQFKGVKNMKISTQQATQQVLEKPQELMEHLALVGESSSETDIKFEDFKKKRIEGILKLLKNYPELMRAHIKF